MRELHVDATIHASHSLPRRALEVLALTGLVLMHDICTIGHPGPV
jgi:hypothetical protein